MDSKSFPFTDEQMLRWEQRRGTLPTDEKLGTEWLDDTERAGYEPPAIIYEGEITTRAGSKYPGDPKDYDVDPAQLFGGAS